MLDLGDDWDEDGNEFRISSLLFEKQFIFVLFIQWSLLRIFALRLFILMSKKSTFLFNFDLVETIREDDLAHCLTSTGSGCGFLDFFMLFTSWSKVCKFWIRFFSLLREKRTFLLFKELYFCCKQIKLSSRLGEVCFRKFS